MSCGILMKTLLDDWEVKTCQKQKKSARLRRLQQQEL